MARQKPLLRLEAAVRTGSADALRRMANRLYQKMVENGAVEDGHNKRELQHLGYTYSARRPQQLHTPPYLVHHETSTGYNTKVFPPSFGKLKEAIRVEIVNQYRIRVGVDETVAPHVRHVIYGTERMVKRDFITGSLHEVQDELNDLFGETLKEVFEGHLIQEQG